MNLVLIFVVFALATYRLTRLTVEDYIAEPLRNLVWRRFPPETSKFGYLFTCYWCMSVWWAGILVVGYLLVPVFTTIVAFILALSTVVGLLDEWRNQ